MLAACLRLKLLWVLMFRPLSPGSVPTNGTTLIRVCGSGGTSWRTSTRWGTACGSQWAASCSRAPRSCRGRCPHAASAESGWYQLMFQSRFPNVHEHLQTDELHVKHEVIYITRSFINNGGQRGRPFLSGRRRHAVSRSEKSPPQPIRLQHVSPALVTLCYRYSSGRVRKCPQTCSYETPPPVCCCKPGWVWGGGRGGWMPQRHSEVSAAFRGGQL